MLIKTNNQASHISMELEGNPYKDFHLDCH